MDAPLLGKSDSSSRTQVRSISSTNNSRYTDRISDIKKKLLMMESAMPAVIAWNVFQMCQKDGISPAAAARKIVQMDAPNGRDWDEPGESALAVLQTLEDLIHYQRKLRMEFEKAEELSEFRDRQLKRKVLDLEARAERNRRLFDEMISDLRLETSDSSNDISLESISSHDLIAFEEMQRLAENEIMLKRKIDELEKKERIYLKTLEQADELWMALKSRTA